MYIQRKSAIHIPLLFKGTRTVEKALLDSGATENFLDRRTVARLKLATQQLKDPRLVYNVDGSNNKAGQITHECRLKLNYGDKELEQRFFVSDLGTDRALLGYPFLQEFNPNIDWAKGRLQEAKGVIVQNTQNINQPRWTAAKEVLHL
jgi:predicted aspartyl protease